MQRSTAAEEGLQYWLRWQVPVCAFIIVAPTVISVRFINNNNNKKKKKNSNKLKLQDLWMPCWRDLHPLWLLLYRIFSFISMAYLLYHTVLVFGPFVFYFYTQWTFVLVMVYFMLGSIMSAHGCWMVFRKSSLPKEEGDEFLDKGSDKLQAPYNTTQFDQQAGFWGNLTQNVYQTCAGASMLTDIVFWCLLLPFQSGDNFKLTLLIGCMHSVNAVFLLLDSALNSLQFPWHRLTYFVLWSSSYVVFQWVMHACGFTWWAYPFLELANPWAPIWYFSLALVHLPCYGVYVLLVKAKVSMFSKLFPQAFIRVVSEEKQA